jgi:glycine/D-amino acid oxidase-like deaminating enzyme
MAKTADVVIIGAGVMGASIAFNLARRGVSNVAVLEKSFIAAGATGKSSACVRQHYSTEVGARMVMRRRAECQVPWRWTPRSEIRWTEWWMMQSAANHSPTFKFPVKQGINREFRRFRP